MSDNNDDELLTLAESVDRLLSDDENICIEDLAAHDYTLSKVPMAVSFCMVTPDERDGVKLKNPVSALSVLLQPEDELFEGESFSCTFYPKENETMRELVFRIAGGLGIKPDDRVWTDDTGSMV